MLINSNIISSQVIPPWQVHFTFKNNANKLHFNNQFNNFEADIHKCSGRYT